MAFSAYLKIARPDHWFKNVFMAPGMLLAFFFWPSMSPAIVWRSMVLGIVAACVIASSNYVLNEILDARYDRFHPQKQSRPIPSGQVALPLAWGWWVLLSLAGWVLGFAVNVPFGITALLLWGMGILYNVSPIRLKDLPYGDVLSESLNNPIRLTLGWYCTGKGAMPPLSIVLAYWMFGAFLMAIKRFAEYRNLNDPLLAARYRKSFAYYNPEKLMTSIFYYATFFGLMGGFFIARYRFELIIAAPLVSYTMAYYLHLAYLPDSPVQHPEQLWRHVRLVVLVLAAFLVSALLLYIDLPDLREWFDPWIEPPSV